MPTVPTSWEFWLLAVAMVLREIGGWAVRGAKVKGDRVRADQAQKAADDRQDRDDAFDRLSAVTNILDGRLRKAEAENSGLRAELQDVRKKQVECDEKHAECEQRVAALQAKLESLEGTVTKIANGKH
jgi:chromosome segregation ATPase